VPPTHPGQELIYLKPGNLYIGDRPAMVTTVLGSCVAVTMHHRASGLAAICHALQPACPMVDCVGSCPEFGRFAACVVHHMATVFERRCIGLRDIEVKLFGGGVIIGRAANGPKPVGLLNAEAAMQTLADRGMRLKVAEAGGEQGRKVVFDTISGGVWVKKLARPVLEDQHPRLI